MSQDERYRQLALFTVIMAEVIVTPVALGGLAYWLGRGSSAQFALAAAGAVAGLGIGFYRISLMLKKRRSDETGGK
ncbi:MAG: hypothetical protein EBX52_06605 [Proteobacteria bacterium]|nr:hypothetical protein [Pseudomonadota bacterium]